MPPCPHVHIVMTIRVHVRYAKRRAHLPSACLGESRDMDGEIVPTILLMAEGGADGSVLTQQVTPFRWSLFSGSRCLIRATVTAGRQPCRSPGSPNRPAEVRTSRFLHGSPAPEPEVNGFHAALESSTWLRFL